MIYNSYVKNEKNVRESSFSTKKKDEDIAVLAPNEKLIEYKKELLGE